MTDYVKATDFASKDTLSSGDPLKKVRGVEIDAEFTAIQTSIATKLDKASPAMTGTPTAPTPSVGATGTQVVNAEWVRLFLNGFLNTYEPVGTIKLYTGLVGSIPTGWQQCDGTNGTPDLRDRFVVGAGTTYAVGDTGGANTVTLGISEMPVHSHSVSITSGGQSQDHNHPININTGNQSQSHTHTIPTVSGGAGGSAEGFTYLTGQVTQGSVTSGATSQDHIHNVSGTSGLTSQNHTHSVSGNTANTGNGNAHENRPPYYAVMFIQKTTPL